MRCSGQLSQIVQFSRRIYASQQMLIIFVSELMYENLIGMLNKLILE